MAGSLVRDTSCRVVTLDAQPEPILIDTTRTAVIVVDMQNDFAARGGMLDRLGIDISPIQHAVGPTANVLAAARREGIKIVYLKMGYRADLADLGTPESVNRLLHIRVGVGQTIRAPNGTESRVLIRDTWNTDIIPELAPQTDDIVIYKQRYSGFYQTDLHALLQQMGITYLIVTGCTTSVCVESTVRDAMFRDYVCVLLADCMGEPIGHDLPRSNHEASLLVMQTQFGQVSDSDTFIQTLSLQAVVAA
jgi:ureidoacrylate peracid hydrolase